MHCTKCFFACPELRDWVTCQRSPRQDVSEQGMEAQPVWPQISRGQVKGGKWGREAEELAIANIFIFPKRSSQDETPLESQKLNVEALESPKGSSKEFPLTGIRNPAFSPWASKIGTKRNGEAVPWGKRESVRRCLPEDRHRSLRLSSKHVLTAYCVSVANLLSWL